eukprot:7726474-Pyramimonas_sp.AAC.1
MAGTKNAPRRPRKASATTRKHPELSNITTLPWERPSEGTLGPTPRGADETVAMEGKRATR